MSEKNAELAREVREREARIAAIRAALALALEWLPADRAGPLPRERKELRPKAEGKLP